MEMNLSFVSHLALPSVGRGCKLQGTHRGGFVLIAPTRLRSGSQTSANLNVLLGRLTEIQVPRPPPIESDSVSASELNSRNLLGRDGNQRPTTSQGLAGD